MGQTTRSDVPPQDGGRRYDALMLGWIALAVFGILLDLWAHFSGLVSDDEGFFTVWHLVLYTGAIGVMALIVRPWWRGMRAGKTLKASMPRGYGGAPFGVVLFSLGGLGDAGWHTAFGIENTTESLFSPTHILLGMGLIILISGPFRAMGMRHPSGSVLTWRTAWAGLISLCLSFFVITALTHYANPWAANWTSPESVVTIMSFGEEALVSPNLEQAVFARFTLLPGAMSFLLSTLFLTAIVATVGRRYHLPLGFWSVLFVCWSLMALMYERPFMVLMAAVIGFTVEGVIRLFQPLSEPERARWACVAVTMVLVASITLVTVADNRWVIHAIAGMPVVAGFFAWLASLFLIPPVWLTGGPTSTDSEAS
jgi:hypothetical protein